MSLSDEIRERVKRGESILGDDILELVDRLELAEKVCEDAAVQIPARAGGWRGCKICGISSPHDRHSDLCPVAAWREYTGDEK